VNYLVDANSEREDVNPIVDYRDLNILHIVNYYNRYVPLLGVTKVGLLRRCYRVIDLLRK